MTQGETLTVAHDDQQFRITYERGTNGRAVIAFAGVGRGLGGIQTEEFRASLAGGGADGAMTVIHVMDLRRRWYNDGTFGPLTDALNALIAELRVCEVVTLGNSMGGFGAIVFARRLAACVRAVAFCPQSSVKPDVAPFEDRWWKWRDEIAVWDAPDAVTELDDAIAYHLFFGADNEPDARHAARFRAAGAAGLRLNIIAGCGHDVARTLRDRGELSPILRALVLGNAGAPRARGLT